VAGTEEQALQPNIGTLERAATFRAIREAAEVRRFISYGDVAAASGLPWSAARRRMDPHLFALCQWSTAQGWPLLSAIVVDKPNLPHGAMRGRPLVGFARASERCGRIIPDGDAVAFLAAEQRRVFAFFASHGAEKERGHVLHA